MQTQATSFSFQLNGELIRVDNVSPNLTLLEFLRRSGRTGTKEGCAEGDCGACSVAVAMPGADGKPCWRAINSCLVPLPALAGRQVLTVEGLKRDDLHPVQAAMVHHHGSQCGYCTPGFVMSLFEGGHRCDLKTDAQLDEQLAGNLCRCTGYRAIRSAALEAFPQCANDGFKPEAPALSALDYAAEGETFHRPTTLAELFTLLAKVPDARIFAGGTDFGLEISKRFKRFPALISLEGVCELNELRETPNAWHIGAAVTLTTVLEKLGGEYPALENLLWWFGSRQIRNRATLGGNLVTASPIGDSAPVLLTSDAQLVLASANGERTVPIADFFTAYRKTLLKPGEVLKTIVLPRNDGFRRMFYKVSKRREMDISTVSACFAVKLDAANRVTEVRIAYGGVAATPVRALKTEAALRGLPWTAETIAKVKPVLATEFTPISDFRGTKEYRAQIITNLLEKFFNGDDPREAKRPLYESPGEGTGPTACRPGPPTRLSQTARMDALPHESGHKHVTGEALYVDDTAQGMLETWFVLSPHARAKIKRRDATAARQMPGIHAVLFADDVPGLNDVGPVRHDEPLLATEEVHYHSQPVALIVGDSQEQCRAAAAKVVVEYEALPALLDLRAAIEAKSFHTPANVIKRGDVDAALATAPKKLSGEFEFGGQDHFYLESQAAWAEVGEDGTVFINSSTQHPSEVQASVAHVLGLHFNSVVVQCPRMGGGFGGKETQVRLRRRSRRSRRRRRVAGCACVTTAIRTWPSPASAIRSLRTSRWDLRRMGSCSRSRRSCSLTAAGRSTCRAPLRTGRFCTLITPTICPPWTRAAQW